MPQSKERKAQYQRDFRARGKGLQNEGTSAVGTSGITKEKAIKLLKIASALDKEITGLQGRENMLDLVRYGSMSMREVREAILHQSYLSNFT